MVLARCKISSLRYYDDKFEPLESLVRDDWRNNWDEHAITGLSSSRSWWNVAERWAIWAADVDMRIDIEQIMQKLAEKYAHSFKHLVALYAVTTQVARKDAAALVGIKAWNFYKTYAAGGSV